MLGSLRFVDRLLHGRFATGEVLRREGTILSTAGLAASVLVLGAVYGACMGLYGMLRGTQYGLPFLVAVMAKVPALFLLTLIVTCPSLYVFAALAGSSLRFREVVRLLLSATAVGVAVLASFAPVTAFFTFSTRSHPFMQVLNAIVFAMSGLAGLRFLHRRLSEVLQADEPPQVPGAPPRSARWKLASIFKAWFVVYCVVAAQMGWILRPFVGSPNLPQELFRSTESNILFGLLQALRYIDT